MSDEQKPLFISRHKHSEFAPDRSKNPVLGDDSEGLGELARGVLGEPAASRIAETSDAELSQLCPRRGENVQWTALEGEAVLVDLDSGVYFTLNRIGSAIWEKLGEERNLDGIIDAVCMGFDANREAVTVDVRTFVADLERERLIRLN